MWLLWIEFAMPAAGAVLYILYTIVFWFWLIYLVDAMKRKRGYYKTTLRCIEVESDPHLQMLAYNAKTELVKFVYLFCLNLVDWAGITTSLILCILRIFVWGNQQELPTDHLPSGSGKWSIPYKLSIPYFGNLCLVISAAILGSLCMYLSARYAQKSWIKSNRIPYWICFFLLSSSAAQVLVIICDTYIIGIWCDKIVVALSVLFVWKQYRKLNMVIQWSIVDLRVSGNIELLEKQVRMKRRFNRIFTTIWIGVYCLLLTNFITLISLTTNIIHRMTTQLTSYTGNHSFTETLLCPTKIETNDPIIIYLIKEIIATIGCLFIFIPYIGYGLCTMFVILWRLFKGKTGYRTHFHVHDMLTKPLI